MARALAFLGWHAIVDQGNQPRLGGRQLGRNTDNSSREFIEEHRVRWLS